MATRVLLVDDDSKLLSLLGRSLAYEGFEVTAASCGADALGCARREAPHVALVDVAMPEMDGFETCRRLRLEHAVPIIMLTARDAVADKVRALQLGADDYLTKPFALEELIARIQAVVRRSGAHKEPLTYADLSVDLEAHIVRRGAVELDLTPKEFELLSLFVRHPRQVLTRQQLIEHAWSYDSIPAANAIEAHVGRLRRKLESGGRPRLIETIRGVGYVLRLGGGGGPGT